MYFQYTTSLLFFTVLQAYSVPCLRIWSWVCLFIIPLGFYQKTVNVCSAYTGSCSYSKRTINAPLTWRKVASALHNVAADNVKPHFIVFIRWLVWYSIHIISLFAFFLHGWLSWKLSYVAHCMIRAQGWCTLLEFILYILSKWATIRLFVKVLLNQFSLLSTWYVICIVTLSLKACVSCVIELTDIQFW